MTIKSENDRRDDIRYLVFCLGKAYRNLADKVDAGRPETWAHFDAVKIQSAENMIFEVNETIEERIRENDQAK